MKMTPQSILDLGKIDPETWITFQERDWEHFLYPVGTVMAAIPNGRDTDKRWSKTHPELFIKEHGDEWWNVSICDWFKHDDIPDWYSKFIIIVPPEGVKWKYSF